MISNKIIVVLKSFLFLLIYFSISITFSQTTNETKRDSITPGGYRYVSPAELAKINAHLRKKLEQMDRDYESGKIMGPRGATAHDDPDDWGEEEESSSSSIDDNDSTFDIDIPLELKKGEIFGVLSAGNVGEITGEPDLSNPKTSKEEKEEIEDQISKIIKLSKENPDIYRPELAKLYNQLYSINGREEMEGQIMDGLTIVADKTLGYIPGTATVWGVSTGLTSLVMGNYKDGIIRLTGAIPWKNFGTVFSALGDIGIITPITNNEYSKHTPSGQRVQAPLSPPVMIIMNPGQNPPLK